MKFLGNPQYLHIKNWIYKFLNKIKNEIFNLQEPNQHLIIDKNLII